MQAAEKANAENFITKFARYYTPVVVIAAVLLAVIPPLFLGMNSLDVWSEWVRRALTFWLFPVLVHLLFLFLWDSSAELAVHQNGVYL